ncbi:MAG: ABC transporter ATP-binding protein [Anaerolineae bacterium]|nr:ABC transporter ATP-binding protein [Anaerolineae bacterium]
MEAIRCEKLTKRYNSVTALDSLDLTVPAGIVFGFLGPNGAGKTTTIKLLSGLTRPTAGRAWLAGAEVTAGDGMARARYGYLPEEPTMYGWMSGREFLTFSGQLFGLGGRALAARVEELLEVVDLKEAARRRVGGYSRGMRQRLGLAQSLINRPPVLLLDEPVSALDPMGRREALSLLDRLRREATVFMSTHILADVERVCDRVAILDHGRLVTEAGQAELREKYATPVFEMELEGTGAAEMLRAKIAGESWLAQATAQGDTLRVVASDLTAAKEELPRAVVANGLTLRRYELKLPSLEDVFVRLVRPQG